MKRILLVLALLVASGTLLAQMGPGMMGRGMGRGMMGGDDHQIRHSKAMMEGLPQAYAGYKLPGPPTEADLAEGKKLFEQYCVSCHGPEGKGNGPAAQGLSPRVSDLSVSLAAPIATDAFLAWTVMEGGVPVGSAMPPFKTVLQPTQLAQILGHLRKL